MGRRSAVRESKAPQINAANPDQNSRLICTSRRAEVTDTFDHVVELVN